MDSEHKKRMLTDISHGLRTQGGVVVSRHVAEMLFGVEPDLITDFALAFSGNRPRSTKGQLIRMFANDNNAEFHFDLRGELIFQRRDK